MKYILKTPITITEIDVPEEQVQPKYNLLYRKLSGEENTYKLNNIVFMDRQILKAVVAGKGYRSFRTDRVISMLPI